LWSVPVLDGIVEEADVKPFQVPTVRAFAPRFGGKSLFYLSSSGAGDGLWRYESGQTSEIWKGAGEALRDPSAISPDGRRATVVLRRDGKRRLHVISADGAELQPVAESIDVRGAASWSPDGKWIVTGGNDSNGAGLFKIPVDGGPSIRIVSKPAFNPVWSPDGELIVYAGPLVALWAPLLGVRADGSAVALPEIRLRQEGERYRFLPNGKGLVYTQGSNPWQDFWLLEIPSGKMRQLSRLNQRAAMRTFDITPDGKQIVFDRLRENSDIVLIDLAL
jgi:Tol biopolymer transport system component